MELKKIGQDFSVCKVADYSLVDLDAAYCFIGKTDEENSLVCVTKNVPPNAIRREDGWKCLRVQGPLDFSLIGILSRLSAILAENAIPIFAVSTYNDHRKAKTKVFAAKRHVWQQMIQGSFARCSLQ